MLELPFLPGLGRPERDNAIDAYLGDTPEDVLDDGAWQQVFTHRPAPFTREEKKAYLAGITGVALGSDAFFPFGDNIIRAARSGVSYVAEPGGSVRDDNVIEECDRLRHGHGLHRHAAVPSLIAAAENASFSIQTNHAFGGFAL